MIAEIHRLILSDLDTKICLHQLRSADAHKCLSRGLARLSPAEVWLNLEILCKVFFWIDFGSPGSTLSESAGCTPGILERFEKFKMASKMAAVSDNSL